MEKQNRLEYLEDNPQLNDISSVRLAHTCTTKYYHNFFGLVVSHEYHQTNSAADWCNLLQDPKTVVLGTVRKIKGTGTKRRCVEVEETMQYIPIRGVMCLV